MESVSERRGPGRPRSIPPEHFETVLQLYKGGLGYRSIANHLRDLGVGTTHTAVVSLIVAKGAEEDALKFINPSPILLREGFLLPLFIRSY